MNTNNMKTQIFHKMKFDLKSQHYEDKFFDKMKYDLKCYPRPYKTTFMPKSFQHIRLWADFDGNLYERCYPEDTIISLNSMN